MALAAGPTPPPVCSPRRTEEALLAATVALLVEGTPFVSLSVLSIARRAGVTRTTFYAYFHDKSALALRLGEVVEDEIAAAAADWLRASRGELRTTLVTTFAVFVRHRAAIGALVDAAAQDRQVAMFWRTLHERFADAARARLTSDVPGLPPELAEARAFALVWATERCFTEHLFAPRVDETALVDTLELLWAAALQPVPR